MAKRRSQHRPSGTTTTKVVERLASLRPIRQASPYLEASVIRQSNRITDVNRTAADDLGTQPAAMNQPAQRTVFGQSLQVRARLAKSCPAETHSTDEKLPFDQVIERNVVRHDIAAQVTGHDIDAVVALEAFDGFDLDQCHMTAATWIMRIGADAGEISITFESPPGDRFDLIAILDHTGADRRDVQRNNESAHVHEVDLRRATRVLISGVCTPSLSKLHVPLLSISWARFFAPLIAAFRKPEP